MTRFFVGIAVMTLYAFGQESPTQRAKASQPNRAPIAAERPTSCTEVGRYQIFFSPNVRADTFLVDTVTGKMWHMVSYTDLQGEPDVWQPMDRVNDDAELMQWWGRHTPKAK